MPDIDWSGPVVEEERQAAALVLLGGDQPLGQPLALGLAVARLFEQARVLDRARREVGKHGRPHVVPAVERLASSQLEIAQTLAVDGERDDHALATGPPFVCAVAAGREDARAARVEETPGLVAGAVEDLTSVERGGDVSDRVDQRLEEGRLRLELVLGRLVAASLRDDQIEGERAEEGRRRDQSACRDPGLAESQAQRADEGGADRAGDEDAARVDVRSNRPRSPPSVAVSR